MRTLSEMDKKTQGVGTRRFKTLYGVKRIPSITQMRSIVDRANPKSFYFIFKKLFNVVQRGGRLKDFELMRIEGNPYYLMPTDGSEYYSSHKIKCKHCMVKRHKNKSASGKGWEEDSDFKGLETYYHQILSSVIAHPDCKQVIPLGIESISKEDGLKKNDCEQNALKRLMKKIRNDHSKLNLIIAGDALYADSCVVETLEKHRMSYILNVKPKGHKKLFLWVDLSEVEGKVKRHTFTETIGEKVKKERTHEFRYMNGTRLNNASASKLEVNFVEYWETTKWRNTKGKEQIEKKHFSWVTDIPINEKNLETIVKAGRCRWKIENETFNTLKTGGYELEHSFGHGKEYLSINTAFLMFLAFGVDQVLGMPRSAYLIEVKVLTRKCQARHISERVLGLCRSKLNIR